MIRNFLKITLRNLSNDSFYTTINILGLTLGMTGFVLIGKFIQHELSYDRHHEHSNEMYRTVLRQTGNEFRGTDLFNTAPMPLAASMVDKVPEVTAATTMEIANLLLESEDATFYQNGLIGDKHLLDVFSVKILEGAINMENKSALAMTQSLAEKFFGQSKGVAGRNITIGDQPMVVSAVIADPPSNQHFQYEFVGSLELLAYHDEDIGRWTSNNYRTYLTLRTDADAKVVEQKIADAHRLLLEDAYKEAPFSCEILLQKVTDIHLKSKVNFELGANSTISNVVMMGTLAFIILLLALINYMNLTTARSIHRAKEVGMRKVLGAKGKEIIAQFLGESFMLTSISIVISLVLVPFLLPSFSALLERDLLMQEVGNDWFVPAFLVFALLVGGLAGLYPATVLSSLKPIKALKGNSLKGIGRIGTFGNILVLGQFTAAIIFAIGSLVVYDQLKYIHEKDVGFDREAILFANLPSRQMVNDFNLIEAELKQLPAVEAVAISTSIPLNTNNQGPVSSWEGNTGEEEKFFYRYHVSPQFIDIFGINLLEGTNFDHAMLQDSTTRYLLNKSAVDALGWQTATGKSFADGVVVGVTEDFHFQPFDLAIEPLFIRLGIPSFASFTRLSVKVNASGLIDTYDQLQDKLEILYPTVPLQFAFLDDQYTAIYRSEQRLGTIFKIATGLAIFIACMGLLGIVAHRTLQRTKEIGIRKVLGASTASIVNLISRDLLKLIAISFLVACPVSWFLLDKWLDGFVYRVDLKPQIFLICGVCTVLFALTVVGLRTVRAATASPIDSLRINE